MKIICSILFFVWSVPFFAQQEIRLYKILPGEEQKTGEKIICDAENNISYVSEAVNPRLLCYSPSEPCGTSVIICPGGGYQRLNVGNARKIAEHLNNAGITVFILIYRLPSPDKPLVAMENLQMALETLSINAAGLGLDKEKIGILGSSAGGHLAAMVATHHTCRPAFLILTWPVISMRENIRHNGSFRQLLGENPTEEQLNYFSPDENVDTDTPPCFIVHGDKDPAVSVRNSLQFYQALTKHHIRSELHIYKQDRHGFGLDDPTGWISQLVNWMSE